MTKTIEMVVKVEVSEPVGMTLDADTVRSLARESVVKVRAVEVGAWNGFGAPPWATVRASVQAYGAVKTVTNAGAVPRRGSDVGTSPLLGISSEGGRE